ncbi:cytochrome c oxidase assembly protein [Halopseudomonas maritima]|uniref:cytochrome c oxidase assembly protein n=1 Tax=Halopseudomonas maritima TaxID=2918528 RepID=UPI001EE9B154|nr:cytochrome c oxidase assembly protein [Halopseudomonas maritima]UJJ32992.1 cytochrome c oxidase assembly protein [Halopseudomonas maritima]
MSETQTNRRLVGKLLLTVVGMFCFGFLMVPLYDVMCEALGINGKTSGTAYQQEVEHIDRSRTLRVQFVATLAEGMSWDFGPEAEQLSLHPGETREMLFLAHNPTDRPMVAQAIPSVSPSIAAAYFHKTECFCFTQQVLQPGESVEMPVRFIVDPAVPAQVKHLTLAYTLFDVSERMPDKLAAAQAQAH